MRCSWNKIGTGIPKRPGPFPIYAGLHACRLGAGSTQEWLDPESPNLVTGDPAKSSKWRNCVADPKLVPGGDPMRWCILLAVAVTLSAPAASYSQTALQAPTTKESKPEDGGSSISQEQQEESSPKSLEKAKKELGRALDRTGEAVKETLGLTKQGCLKRGDEADPYILTESKTGKEITVVGSVDLANHVGHTVRVQGEQKAEGRVFHVTGVEQVASSCDPLPSDQPSSANGSRGELTADDQGTGAADRQLIQAIRQAVVRDEALSIYAQNIKIISRNGFVTLKGLVRSEKEKRSIEAKAVAVAGAGNVSNELSLQAGNSNK